MGFWFEKNGLKFYQFDILSCFEGLVHGVTSRLGGVSLLPENSLNMAFTDADANVNVETNLNLVEEALNLHPLAMGKQNHGINILTVKKADNYNPRRPEDVAVGYDALITDETGVDLLIKLADCQGIILYEPDKRILALVHSGWRGSVQNILGIVVAAMKNDFGADPALVIAGITPSLGPCCAEFINYRQELPEEFLAYKDENDHFNFWAISKHQLIEAGLCENNIEVASVCTKCHQDHFFSYRGGDLYGRFGLIAGMR